MSSSAAALGALTPRALGVAASGAAEPFEWNSGELIFPFEVKSGRLRQRRIVPAGDKQSITGDSSGVEVAIQCSGENSPDQGMKSGM